MTEKARMGALPANGETVVDMFAGIGYYTLPLLVRAKVAKVRQSSMPVAQIQQVRPGSA